MGIITRRGKSTMGGGGGYFAAIIGPPGPNFAPDRIFRDSARMPGGDFSTRMLFD